MNEPGYLTLGADIGLDDADKKNTKAMDRAGVSELAGLKDQWLADLGSLVRAFVDGSGTRPIQCVPLLSLCCCLPSSRSVRLGC